MLMLFMFMCNMPCAFVSAGVVYVCACACVCLSVSVSVSVSVCRCLRLAHDTCRWVLLTNAYIHIQTYHQSAPVCGVFSL